MSITVQLDLPEALAAKAREKGLLNPAHLTQLITRELAEDDDVRDFFQMARDLRSLPGEPMSMDEIQKIVDEVRAERATREAGRNSCGVVHAPCLARRLRMAEEELDEEIRYWSVGVLAGVAFRR
jgi:hypothetical protein